MKKYDFDAKILKSDGIDSGYIEFPYDVETEFGKKGQVKVKALFDGFLYRGSLAKMGHSCHLLGLTKEVRKAIGKDPGDSVHVIIEEDLEERIVEVPADFLERMTIDEEAKLYFEKLSFTHKKEYVRWIESAKKQETRLSRIEKAVEMLKKNIKEP